MAQNFYRAKEILGFLGGVWNWIYILSPTHFGIFNNHPNVTTDTRNIKENSIFFALKGDNFNGNKFARKAIKDGCHYAIIDQSDTSETETVNQPLGCK